MQTGTPLAKGFVLGSQEHLDKRYNKEGIPYASIAEACEIVTVGQRVKGLTVQVLTTECWWKDGITDNDLVIKSGGDNILEYNNLAAFPQIGKHKTIYIAIDTNHQYRWSGTAYVALSDLSFSQPLQEVAGDISLNIDAATLEVVDNKLQVKDGVFPELVDNKIPSIYLPGTVSEIIEVANYAALPGTGVSGKIYITLDDSKQYRWGGTVYVEISSSLALGETADTAYRGDRGEAAYDLRHAPGSDDQDLSGLVEKVAGKSLVLDTEIAKIHAPGSDDQDLSGLVTSASVPLVKSETGEFSLNIDADTLEVVDNKLQVKDGVFPALVDDKIPENYVVPYNWKLKGVTGNESIAATPPTDAEILANKTNSGYGSSGAKVYKKDGNDYIEDGDVPVITTAIIWKNAAHNITDGVMNRCAVWSSLDATPGQFIGFGREIVSPSEKIYFIGVGSDNYMSIEVNSIVVKSFPSGDTLNDHYESWHLFPVLLKSGSNLIHVRGYNDSGPAAIGVEIYDATLAQLQNVATISELNALTIFSTKSLIGSFVEEGNFGTGYTCPAGYSLINRSGIYSCDRDIHGELTIYKDDVVEFKKGTGTEVMVSQDPDDSAHKIVELPVSTNTPVVLTSVDGSVAIDGLDLSVQKAELELYANNEAELLLAWATALAATKAVRIFITGNITFTANRQFIQPAGSAAIKIEAITTRQFNAGSYVIDLGNVVISNISFRTTGSYYFRLIGGYGTFNNCFWVDEVTQSAGSHKIAILVSGAITNGTAKIILKEPTHYTQDSGNNASDLIQPLCIKNESTFSGTGSRLYVEVWGMSSVFEFARFARVLLTSSVADCPYSVTGDASWFYAPEQELPGIGNIKASSFIAKAPTIKIYSGFLSQVGSAAPTIDLLSDMIGSPVWARTGAGTYTLTKTGAFTANKTVPVDDVYTDQDGNLFEINRTSADVMTLLTYAAVNTDVLADGVLSNRLIIIEVYN